MSILTTKECQQYMTAAERYVQRSFEIVIGKVNTHTYANDTDRFRGWCAESLFTGMESVRKSIEAADKGDHIRFHEELVVAFRCALQMSAYQGRCGWWPSPELHDGYIALQKHLEDELRRVR